MTDSHIVEITRVIELAIAPVFLLTAVGALLGVLTSRLGRSVDRRRDLEERLGTFMLAEREQANIEFELVARRVRLIYFAISLAVLCALFICLLIATALAGAFIAIDLSRVVAVMFVLAMIALIGSLLSFLREIFPPLRRRGERSPCRPLRPRRTRAGAWCSAKPRVLAGWPGGGRLC